MRKCAAPTPGGANLHAVDIDRTPARALNRSQVLPLPGDNGGVAVAFHAVALQHQAPPLRDREPPAVAGGAVLAEQDSPAAEVAREYPGADREARVVSEAEIGRVWSAHVIVLAVKRQRSTVFAGCPRGPVDQRAVVTVA